MRRTFPVRRRRLLWATFSGSPRVRHRSDGPRRGSAQNRGNPRPGPGAPGSVRAGRGCVRDAAAGDQSPLCAHGPASFPAFSVRQDAPRRRAQVKGRGRYGRGRGAEIWIPGMVDHLFGSETRNRSAPQNHPVGRSPGRADGDRLGGRAAPMSAPVTWRTGAVTPSGRATGSIRPGRRGAARPELPSAHPSHRHGRTPRTPLPSVPARNDG